MRFYYCLMMLGKSIFNFKIVHIAVKIVAQLVAVIHTQIFVQLCIITSFLRINLSLKVKSRWRFIFISILISFFDGTITNNWWGQPNQEQFCMFLFKDFVKLLLNLRKFPLINKNHFGYKEMSGRGGGLF